MNKLQRFSAKDIVAAKSITDPARPPRLVYLGTTRQTGFPGSWCRIGEHSATGHTTPTDFVGAVGDLLAVSCTRDSELPEPGKLVVLTQRGLYTHIGVLRSDRWLTATRPYGLYRYFVWIESLGINTAAGNQPILAVGPAVGRAAWFRQGGGLRFTPIDVGKRPNTSANALRVAIWHRFFPNVDDVPNTTGNFLADRDAVRP